MAASSGKAAADAAAAAKKEKKEKKEKRRSESDGVKKAKKEKKEKKSQKEKLAQALDEHLQASAAASAKDDDMDEDRSVKPDIIRGALVEFAKPLSSDKHQKKIYKAVKKAAKSHALLRGVKEVNKALRKSQAKTPSQNSIPGLVVIAGDISPSEVIMHLPVACEDVGAPYMFVTSRVELGAASKTKRPTSVVLLLPEGRKGKKDEAADSAAAAAEYAEAYKELVELFEKEYTVQMRGLI